MIRPKLRIASAITLEPAQVNTCEGRLRRIISAPLCGERFLFCRLAPGPVPGAKKGESKNERNKNFQSNHKKIFR